MSTPQSQDVSPWDRILIHIVDKLNEGIVDTSGIQWINHPAPDVEYFPTGGPGGWITPDFDDFIQGDLADGHDSDFRFQIQAYLPEAGGDQTGPRAIRTIAWNIVTLISAIVSLKPANFEGIWGSVRVNKVDFPPGPDGQRLNERCIIECTATFTKVIPRLSS